MKITSSKSLSPLAWLILCSGLVLSTILGLYIKHLIESNASHKLAFASDQITLKIQDRLQSYQLILHSGAGLFASSEAVSRQQWKQFTDRLQANKIVPGVQGIGYAELIQQDYLSTHTKTIRAQGFPKYSVRPAGTRNLYTSIIYLEPFQGRNLRAFGYDMYSEPVRRAAMEQARDSGLATLSGKVQLQQETDSDVQAGTLIYVPVYRHNMPTGTIEQKRAAIIGWTYSPYRMKDLMTGILGNWEAENGEYVDLKIYDGLQEQPDALLYDSAIQPSPRDQSTLSQRKTINFNGKQWLLIFDRRPTAPTINYTFAWLSAAGGYIISALAFALMLSAHRTREKALDIAKTLTLEIEAREQQLKDSEFRWKFAIEGTGDGLWDWDVANGTVFFSKNWKNMLGYADKEISNSLDEWEKRVHPEDLTATLSAVQDHLDGKTPAYISEHRVLCQNGTYKWILDRGLIVSRDQDNKPLRMIGTHSDITAHKEMEEKIRQLALHDSLTKLPNRRLLTERMGQAMSASKRRNCYGALMFLDLDNFKPLNDSHGHSAGDLLLIEVADRLKHCIREMDTAARVGGDEFVVMIAELHQDYALARIEAEAIADKIRHILSKPYLVNLANDSVPEHLVEHHCSASIGVVLFIGDEASQDEILQCADAAMYQAKDIGRNQVWFNDTPA